LSPLPSAPPALCLCPSLCPLLSPSPPPCPPLALPPALPPCGGAGALSPLEPPTCWSQRAVRARDVGKRAWGRSDTGEVRDLVQGCASIELFVVGTNRYRRRRRSSSPPCTRASSLGLQKRCGGAENHFRFPDCPPARNSGLETRVNKTGAERRIGRRSTR
jgi:hypothetical protein